MLTLQHGLRDDAGTRVPSHSNSEQAHLHHKAQNIEANSERVDALNTSYEHTFVCVHSCGTCASQHLHVVWYATCGSCFKKFLGGYLSLVPAVMCPCSEICGWIGVAADLPNPSHPTVPTCLAVLVMCFSFFLRPRTSVPSVVKEKR